ncbi:MAG: hypothetical protein KF708_06290 [Pirellulales bacterium]|nr:hypothetical protein [Pirellulales bacterium]
MAASENQGLQIALIVFVILTIILTVTTFIFYRQADSYRVQSEKDKADAATASTNQRAAESENAELKNMLGFEPTTKVDELKTTFANDMKAFAGTFPPERQFYRPALEYLVTSLRDTQTSLADEKVVTTDLSTRNETREQTKETQIAEHRAAVEQAKSDVSNVTAEYQQDREKLQRQNADLAQQKAKSDEDLKNLRAQLAADVKKLTDELHDTRLLLADTQRKLADLTNETFATADGRIIDVNQRSGTVWINLGSQDDLRQQVTFSVFGPDEHNVNRTKRKGSIEVIAILGSHMAEARIVDDSVTDPLLPGDKIYTPLWHPGRMERFALAGFMDLDNDGSSDRQMVRDLITMSGGKIDAEVDDAGVRTGQMSIDTRFLVIGAERDSVNAELGRIQGEATNLGVEKITLDKFLDHIGWKDTKRLLRYGVTEPGRFSPGPADGGAPSSSGNVTERFKKRPPRSKPVTTP